MSVFDTRLPVDGRVLGPPPPWPLAPRHSPPPLPPSSLPPSLTADKTEYTLHHPFAPLTEIDEFDGFPSQEKPAISVRLVDTSLRSVDSWISGVYNPHPDHKRCLEWPPDCAFEGAVHHASKAACSVSKISGSTTAWEPSHHGMDTRDLNTKDIGSWPWTCPPGKYSENGDVDSDLCPGQGSEGCEPKDKDWPSWRTFGSGAADFRPEALEIGDALGQLSPHARVESSNAQGPTQSTEKLRFDPQVCHEIDFLLGHMIQRTVTHGGEAGRGDDEPSGGDVVDDTISPMLSIGDSFDGASGSREEGFMSSMGSDFPSTPTFWDGEPGDKDLDAATSRFLDKVALRLVKSYIEATSVSLASEAGIRAVTRGAQGETPAPNSTLSGSRPPRQNQSRRRRREQEENEDRDQYSDDEDSQRRPGKKRKSDSTGPRWRLACPYWKLNPREHRGCFNLKLGAMPRVKYHLLIKHTPEFYCERCHETFPDSETHQKHVKALLISCPPSKLDPLFITHRQHSQLSSKANPKQSEHEQWFAIWDILFSGRPPPGSPYIDGELSEDMCNFREYSQANGAAIVTAAMGNEPQLSAEQAELLHLAVSRGLTVLFDRWLSERGPPPPQVAGTTATAALSVRVT